MNGCKVGRRIALPGGPHYLSRTENLKTNRGGGGRTAMAGEMKGDTNLSILFQSVCACLQHWCIHLWGNYKPDEDYICVLKDKSKGEPPTEEPPLSPLGVCTRRETPNCTGESLCISKCNTTVLDFSILFVWSGVSIPIYFKLCKKRLWAGCIFLIYVFFFNSELYSFLFFYLALGLVFFTTSWALDSVWPTLFWFWRVK